MTARTEADDLYDMAVKIARAVAERLPDGVRFALVLHKADTDAAALYGTVANEAIERLLHRAADSVGDDIAFVTAEEKGGE